MLLVLHCATRRSQTSHKNAALIRLRIIRILNIIRIIQFNHKNLQFSNAMELEGPKYKS